MRKQIAGYIIAAAMGAGAAVAVQSPAAPLVPQSAPGGVLTATEAQCVSDIVRARVEGMREFGALTCEGQQLGDGSVGVVCDTVTGLVDRP